MNKQNLIILGRTIEFANLEKELENLIKVGEISYQANRDAAWALSNEHTVDKGKIKLDETIRGIDKWLKQLKEFEKSYETIDRTTTSILS